MDALLNLLLWLHEQALAAGGLLPEALAWGEAEAARAAAFAGRAVSEEARFAAVLAATLALLARSRLRHDLVAVLALLACIALGLVPLPEAFFGFAHPAVITVAAVLILSRGLAETRAIHAMGLFLRRHVRGATAQVASLTGLTAALSGFMNNVGALTLVMPIALRSGKQGRITARQLLMPASFASLLGGMVTLIGTPPNLILAEVRGRAKGESFGLFDFAPVGGAIALAGLAYLVLIGWRLLPRAPLEAGLGVERAQVQAYAVELGLPAGARAAGRKIADLEAATKGELSVLAVMRRGHKFVAPAGWFALAEGDVLLAEAPPEALSEILEQFGFALESGEDRRPGLSEKEMLEAVVTPRSRLVARSALTARLRQRFGVNLIGISRRGETIIARVRDLPLRSGDVLLLQGPGPALEQALDVLECLPLRGETPELVRQGRGPGIILLMGLGLAAVGLGWMPVHVAFLGVVAAAVITRQIQASEVYDSIEWSVLVFIAAMLPVGMAFETSGASAAVVEPLLGLLGAVEPLAAMLAMMAITMILSDVLNNTATAVLMAPVAIALARALGADLDPFLMAVAIAASSTFLTPIGHHANLIVMGPGRYRFGDYWRVGLLLDVIVLAVSAYMIPRVWPF